MRKAGFFIGFLIEGEAQRNSQTAEVFQLLKEQERRNTRLSILLCVASIAVPMIVDIAFRLLGH